MDLDSAYGIMPYSTGFRNTFKGRGRYYTIFLHIIFFWQETIFFSICVICFVSFGFENG